MKNKTLKIVLSVVIAMLIIAVICFYLHGVLIKHKHWSEELLRAMLFTVMLTISMIKLNLNTSRKSLAFYEKAYDSVLGSAFANNPAYRRELVNACRYFDESNYKRAVQILRKLTKKAETEQDKVPVFTIAARCYTESQLPEEAINIYYQLLDISPDNSRAHSNIGLEFVTIGDYEMALKHYNMSLQCDPNNYHAYVNRANLYFEKRDFESAITDSRKSLEIKNNGVEAAGLLAIIYALLQDAKNKEKYYSLAISLGKSSTELDNAVSYYRAKIENQQKESAYLNMSHDDMSKLSDDELFQAVLSRTEHKVNSFAEWEKGINSLNNSQKIFFSLNWLEMEVNNGGLCQFFVNSSRIVAPYISEYMNIIGANDHQRLFDNFVYDNKIDLTNLSSFDVDDIDEYEKQTQRFNFDEYDDAFYSLKPLEAYLKKFIREHLEDF